MTIANETTGNEELSLARAAELHRSGNLPQAGELYRQILGRDADNYQALTGLGRVLSETGSAAEALPLAKRAVACHPDLAEAHYHLGNVFRVLEKFEAAAGEYLRTLALDPAHAEACNYLGNCYFATGQVNEAEQSYQRALDLRPDYPEAHNNMGNVQNLTRDIAGALRSYHRALYLRPELFRVHSNILLSMNYLPCFSGQDIYQESRRWDERFGTPGAGQSPPALTAGGEQRRLRVGYLSPDFRTHSVSFFFEPLLASHDRDQVEVFCYSDVASADQVTSRMQSLADSWCNCSGMPDEILEQQIRMDQIDLLVDLTGHTSMNRLSLFARKPAPIQVSWLGYPGTTGLQAMDYRLTDAVADPEGEADLHHSEELYRLPGGFLCYAAPRAAPRVTSLPLASNGFVTFGSFNSLPKLTEEVLQLWAELLRQLPSSRLLLKNKYFANASVRQRVVDSFRGLGVAESRLTLLPAEPSLQAHLECYGRVDIALDPFPYNGTTTTCESLWMGVPTITLSGERHASRVGASILTRLGLQEHIAATPQQYLAIARELAGDAGRLGVLRASLRNRMAGSTLCDAPHFAGEVEAAYRQMWLRHCREASGALPGSPS